MLTWTRNRYEDLLALGLITVVGLAFFAPVLFGGGWLPYGGGDLVSFIWPTYTFAARTLPHDLPLWNPHLYGGAPFWADNQSGVLYPPNLLLSLLTDAPSYQALEGLVIGHVGLAGLAMYTCLRLLRREEPIPPAPAAVGAVAFMLSDVFVTHQGNLNLIAAAAWLPLAFLGTWRALDEARHPRSARQPGHPVRVLPITWRVRLGRALGALFSPWAMLGGVAFGLGTLAGHAQISYFTVLTLSVAGLWHLFAALRRMGRRRRAASPFRIVAIMVVISAIGLGLSAATLLPALELTRHSGRAGLTYEQAAAYSLPPQALVGLVAPLAHGRGPAHFHGDWPRVEVGYMGLLALTMGFIGAVWAFSRGDEPGSFLAVVGGVAFLLALGEHFPLHEMAYWLLPGFQQIRAPARFVLLFNFAGAALAAMALAWILRPRYRSGSWSRRQKTWWLRSRPYLGWVAALLAGVELVFFGAGVEVQYSDPRSGYDHPEVVAWLQEQPDPPFRIDGATPRWQPDSAALHGGPLYDIYGVSNPLVPAAYDTYYWAVERRGSPAYNFLGAKYVIAGEEPPGDETFIPVLEAEGGVTVYLNRSALPLAHLVYHAVPVESPEAAWEPIHDAAWDPRTTVYVEGGPALEGEPPEGAGLFFSVYEPNALAVVVQTPAPAYLVLSEVYYPGWEATIDGEPAPIYRANTAFRAVYIAEPGEHTVLLAFRPPTVSIGLAITGVTLAALVVIILLIRQPSRP